MVRVLVVDDSAFMRQALTRLLSAAPGIDVVGTARDGAQAVEKTRGLRPDVVTLDVEMPVLDGLGALRAIMRACPTPVVMVSSQTRAQAETTVEALCAGAADFVTKPSGTVSLDIDRVADELVQKVRAAAGSPTRGHAAAPVGRVAGGERQLLVVGCSTGGPRALGTLLPALPEDLPVPVLVVQHMPPGFTAPLAERLDRESRLRVREACAGDGLERGVALVAPGGRHLVVRPEGRVALDDGPPVHGVRPAVDVTVASAVAAFGAGTVVAILTGMGMDGAQGAHQVRRAGGRVLAESAETCVVYGMPRAVVEMGNADCVAPLHALPGEIVAALSRREVGVR